MTEAGVYKSIYSLIGKVAPLYDVALRLSGYEKSVRYFISQLPFPEDAPIHVLDAGCGSGLYALGILKRYKNAHIVAFDIDSGLVAHTKEKFSQSGYDTRSRVFTGDVTDSLPELQHDTFDLILTAGVLEYTPLKQTVANLSRFLAPGGYFFNSPIRTTAWGHLVARMYGCTPYERDTYIDAFKPLEFVKIISLPSWRLSSFKEGQLFRRTS